MQRSIVLHCSHYFHCPKCGYDLCPACAGVEESPPPGLFGGAPAPAAGLFGGPSMYPSPQLWKVNCPGRDYNIRSGPSLFASVVTTVTHGTMLQMKGEVNGWLILEDGRGYTAKQPQDGIGGWHRTEESMPAPPADLFGSAQSPPATASPSASAPPEAKTVKLSFKEGDVVQTSDDGPSASNIVEAWYGARLLATDTSHGQENTRSAQGKLVTEQARALLAKGELKAVNELFGDPAPNQLKVLELTITPKPAATMAATAAEEEAWAKLCTAYASPF